MPSLQKSFAVRKSSELKPFGSPVERRRARDEWPYKWYEWLQQLKKPVSSLRPSCVPAGSPASGTPAETEGGFRGYESKATQIRRKSDHV